jgi:hypothetical protein
VTTRSRRRSSYDPFDAARLACNAAGMRMSRRSDADDAPVGHQYEPDPAMLCVGSRIVGGWMAQAGVNPVGADSGVAGSTLRAIAERRWVMDTRA